MCREPSVGFIHICNDYRTPLHLRLSKHLKFFVDDHVERDGGTWVCHRSIFLKLLSAARLYYRAFLLLPHDTDAIRVTQPNFNFCQQEPEPFKRELISWIAVKAKPGLNSQHS